MDHRKNESALPDLKSNPLLTLPQAAVVVGLGYSVVRRAVLNKKLKAVKLGARRYIRQAWLMEWIDGSSETAKMIEHSEGGRVVQSGACELALLGQPLFDLDPIEIFWQGRWVRGRIEGVADSQGPYVAVSSGQSAPMAVVLTGAEVLRWPAEAGE